MAQTLTIAETLVPGIPVHFRNQPRGGGGAKRPVMKVVTLGLSGTYATGGVVLGLDADAAAEAIGLDSIIAAIIPPTGGIVFEYDLTTAKILQYWVDTTVDGAAMAQVANTTNLGALTTRALFFGTEA